VLAPTRELAIQIDEACRVIAHAFGMKTACLIGGAPMDPQVQAFAKRSPFSNCYSGKTTWHMSQWNFLPDNVVMLVLDEADRMLDMGFAPQIEKILRFLPKERPNYAFFPQRCLRRLCHIASKYMKLPLSVEIALPGQLVKRLRRSLFIGKKRGQNATA